MHLYFLLLLLGAAAAVEQQPCVILWARSSYGGDCTTPCIDGNRAAATCTVQAWSFASWLGSWFGVTPSAIVTNTETCAPHTLEPKAVLANSTSSWVRCEPNNRGCIMRNIGNQRCRTEPIFGFNLFASLLKTAWTCLLDSPGALDLASLSSERPCALNGTHAVYTSDADTCSTFMGYGYCV
ncbi:hypothetical protein [Crucian carp herpesvirus]|uniref:ORF127 n=1 Tax=Cyprinid herpesvirus 2 TaxID=317878 RepID=K7PBG7_CYHV2|nr:protein ORF127 [Cyprinid herpesvirus 2]APD51587.1 hypothetical protein [Crucian carp herpesvirus]AFJ20549.1 protein ORF127 [Cyprinid herpesvirus 2]AKC02067.1 hypothetical protein [Cyprinid herpesvirus 2]AMB21693.1 ORF127 [Cyprinid herpesvirus 2]QAU54846.1 protein ORF127 [Cyprinid herpesvirus 2]